ncbi:hypothetical protein SUGI_1204270 [Cryptomeria japonica]|uniref:uncharacterized protein LOC131859817 isoform X2 n=1 Tax=Cryptomeria japonica TaxID=3369 RepID=UPI002414B564|nr:uncharacterized protein LOC131859817 isoform X2 [Cryptomeria japonica]GLJ56097.1 hypothetical protein SUGI_1204270 [Cryptomeria japonica]
MLRITAHFLLFLFIQIQGENCIKPIVAINTEVPHESERETSHLKYIGEISMRKEELCTLRHDPENELSHLRYCMELKLEPNTSVKGPFEHFVQYFNWLKLGVVNSVIPGDSVGPLGAQLTFGVSRKHIPKRENCDNKYKSAWCQRIYRTLLLDAVLVNSRSSGALHGLLSQPPLDTFMGSPIWTRFENLVGFWHEFMLCSPEKSQFCEYSSLSSLNAEDGNHLCDITSTFLMMLTKRSDLWHRHSTSQWLTKQFSLLINHEERQGLFITYCEIGSQESHSANANMIDSDKSDSPSANANIVKECYTDLSSELEMIDLQRVLIGKGAHRHLSSFMKFKYHSQPSSALPHQFCEIVMMERLQSGIFVDPFELQRLVNRGALNAAFVYGDANLELPARHSHQSIVEVRAAINVDSATLFGNNFEFELKVDLPLHARYPALGTGVYSVVNINIPHVLMHCIHESNMLNLKTSRTVQTHENETLTWVTWGRGTLHMPEVLKWKIPAGNQLHAHFVTIVTSLSALASIVAIILASLYSFHYS